MTEGKKKVSKLCSAIRQNHGSVQFVWEDRSRPGCQSPHSQECAGFLSPTSWKKKLMARRKDRMIRDKVDSKERKVTDPQILVHWGCADEDHLGKLLQAMVFGLECWRDATRLW